MNRHSMLFVALSALGIVLAIYHAAEELAFVPSNGCNISQIFSCQSVFASGYTSLFGIPFYVYGLVWFPLMLILGLLVINHPRVLIPTVMVGNIFTTYLWYIDIFVINAYCIVCISMYVVNYALTAIAISKVI